MELKDVINSFDLVKFVDNYAKNEAASRVSNVLDFEPDLHPTFKKMVIARVFEDIEENVKYATALLLYELGKGNK